MRRATCGESSDRFWRRPVRLLLATFFACVVGAGIAASSAFALSPSVSTLAAANVADTTATLNGSVNPNGLETKTYFEYGPTVAYGSKTAEVNVGSGSSTLEKAQGVTGLTANTTYHYRIVATNSSGTSQGTDRTFTVGWVVQTPVSLGATGYFEDVSCSSATECTAVGVKEEGVAAFVQRWNGTEWKSQTPAKPVEAVKTAFTGVSCPSSSTCYAVGQYTKAAGKWLTLIEAWNGTEWKVQTSPNPEGTQFFLEDISCSSESECTAVGWYQNAGPPETSKTLALRWNGTEWSIQESKNPTSNSMQLRSVSCTSSTFCMAAGFYYYESKFVYTPLSERWDGTNWTIEEAKPVEGKMNWLYGVSCTSSTACTAVGAEEVEPIAHETKTMARRWNGTEWSTQTMAKTEGGSSLADVSCTSSTVCAAVGDSGSENPLEMRWNGSTWTLLSMPLPSSGNTVRPFAVSCIAARGCEAVGEYRLVGPTVYPLAEGRWRSAAPATTTGAASEIGEKSATISGTVNPNGSETKAFFEYGTTTSYGSSTTEVNIGSGTSSVEKTGALSGLSPNTTYHYRLVANNENPESGKGEDKTFTTLGPPTVTTEAGVSEESGETATLNGVVNPNGQSTTYQFEYGTTSGVYTKTVPEPAESAGSGTTSKAVSYTITGLTRGTKYYFRLTATNAGGKTTGSEHSFLTDSAPGVTTSAATGITAHGATLNGTIAPHGLVTKYQFEYGTTTSYGSKVPVSPAEVKPESESISVEQGVSGLAEETIYHYRLVAENALGSSAGEDKTFTTSATENVGSTVLCTEQKVKCPIGKTDGTGTEIKANLVSGTKFKITTGFKTIECSKSSIKGKVSATGEKISVSVETLTFEECNCTIAVLKKGELIFGHITSTDNATLTSNGAELTGNCSTIFGTVHCIYATSNTDMGTLEGGNPAKIKSSAANIPRLTTNGLCNEEASWDAEYEVTSPKPLYIET
jgi:hypothetical protein